MSVKPVLQSAVLRKIDILTFFYYYFVYVLDMRNKSLGLRNVLYAKRICTHAKIADFTKAAHITTARKA